MAIEFLQGISTFDIGRPKDGGPKRVLGVIPHPDDEAIGAGGTFAQHARRGDIVYLAVLTLGDLGGDPLKRKKELFRSSRILGVPAQNITILGLPDSKVAEHHDDAVPWLANKIATLQITDTIRPQLPDYHEDHTAAAEFLIEAIDAAENGKGLDNGLQPWSVTNDWGYEVSPELLIHPDEVGIVNALDGRSWLRKRAAVRSHWSQAGIGSVINHTRNIKAINAHRAERRHVGTRYGEAFQIGRHGDLPVTFANAA